MKLKSINHGIRGRDGKQKRLEPRIARKTRKAEKSDFK